MGWVKICHRGRTAKVDCKPSTRMIDVLERGCRELGLDHRQHHLVYKGKEVETNVPYRLGGLLPNAEVHLRVARDLPGRTVRLGIRLQNGTVAKGVFRVCETTLWDALLHLEKSTGENLTRCFENGQYLMPVLSEGSWTTPPTPNALVGVYLADAGYRGGSAKFRLSFTHTPMTSADLNLCVTALLEAQRPYPAVGKGGEQALSGRGEDVVMEFKAAEEVVQDSLTKLLSDPMPVQIVTPPAPADSPESAREPTPQVDRPSSDSSAGTSTFHPMKAQTFSTGMDEVAMMRSVTGDEGLVKLEPPRAALPVDRQLRIFEKSEVRVQQINMEVTHDFYETKAGDVVGKRRETRDGFRAKSLEKQTTPSYTHTTIRALLPDGVHVEACFSPEETTGDVLDFIRGLLINGKGAYLFTTPPRKILPYRNASTLREQLLVPSAKIHVGIQQDAGGPYLRDAIMENLEERPRTVVRVTESAPPKRPHADGPRRDESSLAGRSRNKRPKWLP